MKGRRNDEVDGAKKKKKVRCGFPFPHNKTALSRWKSGVFSVSPHSCGLVQHAREEGPESEGGLRGVLVPNAFLSFLPMARLRRDDRRRKGRLVLLNKTNKQNSYRLERRPVERVDLRLALPVIVRRDGSGRGEGQESDEREEDERACGGECPAASSEHFVVASLSPLLFFFLFFYSLVRVQSKQALLERAAGEKESREEREKRDKKQCRRDCSLA